MAKPTAPLLAFSASGTVAKTVVFSRWRGRSYVRRWTSPANPQSTSQMQTRDVFSFLQQVWKEAPTDFQNPWSAFATGKPLTNRNAFGSHNIGVLRTLTALTGMVFSPGANAGLAPTAAVATPGSGQLSVAITAPTTPTGWTLTDYVAAALRDQDPHTGTYYTPVVAKGASSPVVVSGLTSSQLYQFRAWLIWTKPDGTLAYGASIGTTATPS